MFSPMRKTHPVIKIMNKSLIDLPTPNNLSTMWNFGSLLGMCLIIQIITGMFLAMHYTPHIEMAFSSVNHISRDVNYGWLLKSIHANGASLFFLCLYIHMGRGIYYKSFMFMETWNIGVVIFIITMAAAFMGYVLPWGQMSFWGATVITNLFSAIPYIGNNLVQWMWGGFAVDNATLNRFFSIHFLLPFIIAALSMVHLLFLHSSGSNNPLGILSNMNLIPFHHYHTTKDLLGMLMMMILLISVSMFYPNMLGDPENFIPANPLITPIHIKPEWYFLWAYAILRSIPNKLGGVIAMFSALIILFIIPLISKLGQRSNAFSMFNQLIFWALVTNMILLTWIGGCPVEPPYEMLGKLFTTSYFILFLMNPIMENMYLKF